MSKLRYYGDPILRQKCQPIEKIDDLVLQIAQELIDICREHNGSGLAAPQIGYPLRMFAVSLSDEVDQYGNPLDAPEITVFMNPVISNLSKKKETQLEGCMSIPGVPIKVERPKYLDIEAIDPFTGKSFTEKGLSQWRARCILHEYDHLEGILITDYLSEKEHQKLEHKLLMITQKHRYSIKDPKAIQ